MYKCKKCGEEFETSIALAGHHNSKHRDEKSKKRAAEKLSKSNTLERIKIKKQCLKCGTEFEVERNVHKDGTIKIPKREKTYCSPSCSHSHSFTEETREKISKGLKGNIPWNKSKEACTKKYCKVCGKEVKHKNKTGYCLDCWRKSEKYSLMCSRNAKNNGSGGYREGSVKSYKSGRYDGIWFDSSWELAYYLYHKENNVNIVRCDENFPYKYEGVERRYHPDFMINDTYIEIKGYERPETDAKIRDFPHKLEIVRRDDMKYILEYMENKYGKEFWNKFYS